MNAQTVNNKREAYAILIKQAKAEGATRIDAIIANSGSEKNVEIPNGFKAVGIKAYFTNVNERDNFVNRTNNYYGLYKGGEELYTADLFKF